ncbi:MAG: DUF4382 domain-containing protein [Candidatus Micrarchaeota archaeon]|nr:DUF4382 domain-containing protein [Candidatus Micrarchaeota archaeon]
MNKALYILVAVIVIGIAAYSLYRPVQATGLVTLQLTDPPHVPDGTSSLVINYSSVQVHFEGSGWTSLSASGSMNLMSLVNFSRIMATLNAPLNSTIDNVRFNITGASITIGNATYPVTLPSRQVNVSVHAETRSNATTNLLMDMSPTVATVVTNTSTVFVMVPSLRAVIVYGNTSSRANATASVGKTEALNHTVRRALDDARPNITITGAEIVSSGNSTRISVTVKDNSNSSVQLKHVLVFGNESISAMLNFSAMARAQQNTQDRSGDSGSSDSTNASLGIGANANASESGNGLSRANASASEGENANVSGSGNAEASGSRENGSARITAAFNSTEISDLAARINNSGNSTELENEIRNTVRNESELHNISINQSDFNETVGRIRNVSGVVATQQRIGVLNFLISNSTLYLPASEHEFENDGYTLAPNQSVTLTFDGQIALGSGVMTVSLVQGSAYKIEAIGEEGASATMLNVTAT